MGQVHVGSVVCWGERRGVIESEIHDDGDSHSSSS